MLKLFKLISSTTTLMTRSINKRSTTLLRKNNKYFFSFPNESEQGLEMLESYTEGMISISEDNWKKGIIKFTETAEIFENMTHQNLKILQALYFIKQKQLLCFYHLKQYNFCLEILKEIKEINDKLISFVNFFII